MFQTLRAKLTVSYTAVAVLCVLLALSVMLALARDYAQKNGFKTLGEKSHLALPLVRVALVGGAAQRPGVRVLSEQAVNAIRQANIRILLLDPDSFVVDEDTRANNDAVGKQFNFNRTDIQAGEALTAGGKSIQGTTTIPGELGRLQYIAQIVRSNQAGVNNLSGQSLGGKAAAPPLNQYILVVTQPEPTLGTAISDASGQILTGLVAAVLVALLVAFLLARSISQPVSRLARAAEAMAHGDYSQRIQVEGRDELATLTAEFNEMAEEVGRAHQMQRDFTANVSHDLKTPLTSIQGFSQAMLDGTIRDEAGHKQAAGIINTEAQRMSRLVSELLSLSQLQSGLISLEMRPMEIGPMLSQLALAMQPQANSARVDLVLTVQGGGAMVMADEDRLKQAFGNLVDNAIKHTPAGGRVSLLLRDIPSSVEVSVTDTGKGIPPEDLPRVMERFYQVDKARSPQEGRSVGLGLAIAREIIQAHHGQVSIESRPGSGTTVRVSLASTSGDAGRTGVLKRLQFAPKPRGADGLSTGPLGNGHALPPATNGQPPQSNANGAAAGGTSATQEQGQRQP